MLVISRRKGQSIAIGDEIELVVTELHRSVVKIAIRAPRGTIVLRGEVRDSIAKANQSAAESTLDGTSVLDVQLQEIQVTPAGPPNARDAGSGSSVSPAFEDNAAESGWQKLPRSGLGTK